MSDQHFIAGEPEAMREQADREVSWDTPHGRVLTPFAEPSEYLTVASMPGTRAPRPHALQLTRYDPGSAAYRYHSAANSVGDGGTSAFVRFEHTNPHCDLRQYDGTLQRAGVRRLLATADVAHVHMEYSTLSDPAYLGKWHDCSRTLLIRHYHGSQPTSDNAPKLIEQQMDDVHDAVQIGARLYHQRFSPRMYWLPIPMPVRDYELLRARHFVPIEQRRRKAVRIAHSPTHPRIKGTIVLETVVSELIAKGLDIELVMIAGMPQADALIAKATCDITFDSFWLGIQGSGLEAACMGQAVIAGDSAVRDEYVAALGYCPYTYAPHYDELRAVLEQLIVDENYRASEAAHTAAYVRAYHDYPIVGQRYWQIVRAEMAARGLEPAEEHATVAA